MARVRCAAASTGGGCADEGMGCSLTVVTVTMTMET